MDEKEKKLALESFAAFERMQLVAQNLITAIEEGCVRPKGAEIVEGVLFLPYKDKGKYIMIRPWGTVGVVRGIGSINVGHGLSDDEVCQLTQAMEGWLRGET